jgi:hypothetical protein
MEASKTTRAFGQRNKVLGRVVLDTPFAEINACGINGVIDAVFFMEVDSDKGRGFSDNGG